MITQDDLQTGERSKLEICSGRYIAAMTIAAACCWSFCRLSYLLGLNSMSGRTLRGPQKTEPVEHTSTHTSGGGFWAWLFGDESMTETTRSMHTDDIYDRSAAPRFGGRGGNADRSARPAGRGELLSEPACCSYRAAGSGV